MISKEEVIKIANLARLQLNSEEIEKMQKDLSSVLDYFEILKKAPKAIISQKAGIVENTTRIDEVGEKSSSLANNLIGQAPDKKDGYIKVKSIF